MATISFTDSNSVQQDYLIRETPVLIGRHPDCEIQLDDASASRYHAKITLDNGHFYLQDMNSRNGTTLNGDTVAKPTRIFDRTRIKIGDSTLTFIMEEPRSGATTAQTSSNRDRNGKLIPASNTLRKSQLTARNSPVSSQHLNSIFLDDPDTHNDPSILSQLEAPSHFQRIHNHTTPEQTLVALTKITHALSESVERNQVLTKILDFLLELFNNADRGFIILKNKAGELEPVGWKSRYAVEDERIHVSKTIIKQVIDSKRPMISSDAAADDRFDLAQSIVDFKIRSLMCAPMINSKDEVIGVIHLDTVQESVAFNEEELETLTTIALQASLAVQKSDLFEAAKRSESLKLDLQVANEIQRKFLPQHAIKNDRYEFSSYYRPMQQVGGDYFDYVKLDGNRVGIVVADVVGHGVAAALLMAKVSAESRFALATCKSAEEAIQAMNTNLSDLKIDRFVTLALALVDFEENKMTIVNAGHMPPLLRNKAGEYRSLAEKEAGIPLGIANGFQYESMEVALEVGDVVTMYTDGVNEAMNASDEQLTTARLIDELKQAQCKTPQTICEQIVKIVSRHAGNTPAIDDMCAVCFGRIS